jgi:hypothetical protein
VIRHISALAFLATSAVADPVTVVDVTTSRSGESWTFNVTLAHPDTGWDHYADAWEVTDADGNSLGIRELAHPHETEQPFTRSLSGVVIPEGMTVVYVRARCLVDGWNAGGTEVPLD